LIFKNIDSVSVYLMIGRFFQRFCNIFSEIWLFPLDRDTELENNH
jgi:hypothetical protein